VERRRKTRNEAFSSHIRREEEEESEAEDEHSDSDSESDVGYIGYYSPVKEEKRRRNDDEDDAEGGVGSRGTSTPITRLRCLTDPKVQRIYVRKLTENDTPGKRKNSKSTTSAPIDDNISVRLAPTHLQRGREPSPRISRKPSPSPARGSSSRTVSILDRCEYLMNQPGFELWKTYYQPVARTITSATDDTTIDDRIIEDYLNIYEQIYHPNPGPHYMKGNIIPMREAKKRTKPYYVLNLPPLKRNQDLLYLVAQATSAEGTHTYICRSY
jgi:hypothetical protein